ncbi:MAG: putative lipid II flippase FtsW [Actinomycetota bacterium]|nr:putative lipid II flippase FtsW [Actinomycetota bacterium]
MSSTTSRVEATSPSSGNAVATFLDKPLASFHLVLGAGGALAVFGLAMVFSASSVESLLFSDPTSRSPFGIFDRQAIYLLVGLVAVWLGLRLRPSMYRRLAYPALLAAVVLLAVVLVPAIGQEMYGARRWLDVGLFQLQPSELAKVAFVLWGADLLVRKQKMLGEWRHLLIPLVPVGMLLGGLVMLEPDLGTTLCFVLILFALLWTVGAPLRMFMALFAAMIAGVVALIAVEPYRMQRIVTYLDPFSDPEGAGLQSIRGMYALATGGWWGVGLGNSRMKWGLLPNGHSDYIFAIVGEELGFVGCLILLALFGTLAYAGLRIARRTSDPFIRLVSAAVIIWLVGQAIINIGYVVGLLPVTGVPLPLISSGGTSLVVTMFIVGMLAGFARHEPDAVAHLRRHGQGRTARLLRLPIPRSAVDGLPRRRR